MPRTKLPKRHNEIPATNATAGARTMKVQTKRHGLLEQRTRAGLFSFGKKYKVADFILYDHEREAGDLWFFENWNLQFQEGIIVCLHDVLVGTHWHMHLLEIGNYRYFPCIDDDSSGHKESLRPIRFQLAYPDFFDLDRIYRFYKFSDDPNEPVDPVLALSTVIYECLVKLGAVKRK